MLGSSVITSHISLPNVASDGGRGCKWCVYSVVDAFTLVRMTGLPVTTRDGSDGHFSQDKELETLETKYELHHFLHPTEAKSTVLVAPDSTLSHCFLQSLSLASFESVGAWILAYICNRLP